LEQVRQVAVGAFFFGLVPARVIASLGHSGGAFFGAAAVAGQGASFGHPVRRQVALDGLAQTG
jgi:hypothetical protein